MNATDVDTDLASNAIHRTAEPFLAVKAKRGHILTVVAVITGLLASAAWSGVLGWMMLRMIL